VALPDGLGFCRTIYVILSCKYDVHTIFLHKIPVYFYLLTLSKTMKAKRISVTDTS